MVVVSEFACAAGGRNRIPPRWCKRRRCWVAVLVVDPLHGEAGMQHVPGRTFISFNHGAFGIPTTVCRYPSRLGREHLRERHGSPRLAHRHDNPALARLVLGEPAINPVSGGQVLLGRTWPPK